MISGKKLFIEISNQPVHEDGESVGYFIKNSRMNDLDTLLNATAQPVSNGCKWSFDDDGYWKSACGITWVFNDGGPIENEYNFCQKCGGKVVLEPAPGGQDD